VSAPDPPNSGRQRAGAGAQRATCAKREVARALPRFDHGHTPVTYGQIALPAGISGIGSGEALAH